MGWPLTYTLSPVIHNAAFRRSGLDWVYLAWPVAPDSLPAAVAGLRALGGIGANVTMPHKSTIIPELDDLSGTRVSSARSTRSHGWGTFSWDTTPTSMDSATSCSTTQEPT